MSEEKFQEEEGRRPSSYSGNNRGGYYRSEGENRMRKPGGYGSNYSPRPRYGRDGEQGNGGYRQNYNGGSYAEGGYNRGYGQRPHYNREENNGERGYRPRPQYQQEGSYRSGEYRSESRFNKRPSGYNQEYRNDRYARPADHQREENNGEAGNWQPRQGGYRQQPYRQGGYGRPQRTPGYNPHAKYSMKKRLEYNEEHIDPNAPLRLNKYLANAGICSRRDADKYIAAGVVTVNGEVVTELGTKVMRTDVVKFHDNSVKIEKKVYVLLNKPKGYVTTSEDPQERKTVMDLVKEACPERIYPVGRLDRNTTGVLLLTNDGELAAKLTHPKFLKKKIYHVHLDKNVTLADLQQIADGITLEDGEIKADAIEYASPTDKKQVGIEIHSGKNRIVRRIFESLGYHVVKLDRVFFAGLTKKNVRRGDWRFLTEKEVNMLRMGAYE